MFKYLGSWAVFRFVLQTITQGALHLCRPTELVPLESSDTAINAMAPVLENVLVCLTQEYEKRLHAKDHEVKASQHDVKAAQTALKQAQMELYEAHKTLAQNANALPVCESQPGALCSLFLASSRSCILWDGAAFVMS